MMVYVFNTFIVQRYCSYTVVATFQNVSNFLIIDFMCFHSPIIDTTYCILRTLYVRYYSCDIIIST